MNNQPEQPSNQQGPQYYPPQGQQQSPGPVQGPRLPQIGGSGGRGGFNKWIILAVVAVIVVCGGLTLLRGLGSGTTSQPLPVPTIDTGSNPSGGTGQGGNPSTGSGGSSSSTGPQLGQLVTASSIGAKNAPGNVTTTFPSNSSAIYAVIQGISVPQGSTFFARWFRDNQPFEDSPEITANQQYTNTYIEFHLQPKTSGALQPGNYGVQIFVNGNPGPSTAFTVQ